MRRGERTTQIVSVRLPAQLVTAAKHELKGGSFSGLVEALLVGYLEGRRSSGESGPCRGLGSAWDAVGGGEPATQEVMDAPVEAQKSPSVYTRRGDLLVSAYIQAHGVPAGHHKCPCRSGAKWRHCHGRVNVEARGAASGGVSGRPEQPDCPDNR